MQLLPGEPLSISERLSKRSMQPSTEIPSRRGRVKMVCRYPSPALITTDKVVPAAAGIEPRANFHVLALNHQTNLHDSCTCLSRTCPSTPEASDEGIVKKEVTTLGYDSPNLNCIPNPRQLIPPSLSNAVHRRPASHPRPACSWGLGLDGRSHTPSGKLPLRALLHVFSMPSRHYRRPFEQPHHIIAACKRPPMTS